MDSTRDVRSETAGATPPTGEPVPAPAGTAPDQATHCARLLESLAADRDESQPRDPAWQHDQRLLEARIRAEAAACAEAWQNQGLSVAASAHLLDLPERTLRLWQHNFPSDLLVVHNLGRPHVRCAADQANGVLSFLHGQGPWVGLPTLRGQFPDLPRAELQDLLAVYRHLWTIQHPRELYVLHWHPVGAVWAVDFTKVSRPIDGLYPYVFAARDLASGRQLSWLPVLDLTTATAHTELEMLFTIHGAPLVLKSDNGSAFRAERFQALLARWQVGPLYSPPGVPSYNGAIEASIGSLKRRTQFLAERFGHTEAWTSSDLERARDLANTLARPRGPHGPTPEQAWESRRPPTQADRDALAARLRLLEPEARRQAGIAPDAALDHYEQAALQRRVLTEVLVERGILSMTRRRVPQTFFGKKAASIR